MALGIYTPGLERVLTDDYYGRVGEFLDSTHVRGGFFPFEDRALERFFPRPPALLFVPGAGAGREALALLKKGYQVDAIEPALELFREAREVLGEQSTLRLTRERIQEWTPAQDRRYAGILTGWAFWMCLIRQSDRLRALESFRRACPEGPVLLSFYREEPYMDQLERETPLENLQPSSSGRMERLFRESIRVRLLDQPPVERGTHWVNGVYMHWSSEKELVDEASRCLYVVAHYETNGSLYPHAVLLPAR
jgi:hypothetical protein